MSSTSNQARSRLIFGPEELDYDFGKDHPLQARRLVALMDLLKTSGYGKTMMSRLASLCERQL
jgi:hypothetical protein